MELDHSVQAPHERIANNKFIRNAIEENGSIAVLAGDVQE